MIEKLKTLEIKYFDKLLEIDTERRNIFQIIIWWEIMRFFYNLIIFFFGTIILTIISCIVNVPQGVDVFEPFAIIGFIILCNFGYTLGWLTEISIKKSKTYATKMFKNGLYFTISVIMVPLFIHILLWIFRGFKTMY
jgi:hypothetical protein